MRGHAFLTSSAETEAAQESDRIRASYFTHYLISGFRGAADLSGDGKVTLNEAYQFAFNETLGRTVDTKGGAQHPSYDINMSGTGDVVMTDVRQTTRDAGARRGSRRAVLHPHRRAGARRRAVQAARAQGGAGRRAGRVRSARRAARRDRCSPRRRSPTGRASLLEPRQFGVARREADAPPRRRRAVPPRRRRAQPGRCAGACGGPAAAIPAASPRESTCAIMFNGVRCQHTYLREESRVDAGLPKRRRGERGDRRLTG